MPSIGCVVFVPVFCNVPAMMPSLLTLSCKNMVGVGPEALLSWVMANTPSGIQSGSFTRGMLVAICSAAAAYWPALSLPGPGRFSSEFSGAAWRTGAGALLKEVAGCLSPAGRQRAGPRPGAGAADIEERVQLTCTGTLARRSHTWLATRAQSWFP